MHFRCIRVIARNIDQYTDDDCDLSQLPMTIKTDILQLNMKLSIGFRNEFIFIQLLTPIIPKLLFRSSILTDKMLLCIGERCTNLQELRSFDDKYKNLDISTNGLINCIKELKNLRALQIADCRHVTDKVVELISQSCPHLESLWLNDCKNVTDKSSNFLKFMRLNDLNLTNTGVMTNN